MITRFLTDVRVKFNPFSRTSKSARVFLSLIPPSARADGMKIESKMLPRDSKEPAELALKFSTFARKRTYSENEYMAWTSANTNLIEDGKEMNLEIEKMRITEVMEQVDRHSRILARKEELSGN